MKSYLRSGSVKIISQNILKSKLQYIAHHVPCVGKLNIINRTIFKKFRHANPFEFHTLGKIKPGGIFINHGDSDCDCQYDSDTGVRYDKPMSCRRSVITMFTQYYATPPTPILDTKRFRFMLFKSCLEKIIKLGGVRELGLPYGVGLDDDEFSERKWDPYMDMLCDFAEKNRVRVVIYDYTHSRRGKTKNKHTRGTTHTVRKID